MPEKLYICSGVNGCSNVMCDHYEPHTLEHGCLNGKCNGVFTPCVPYKPNEFNLKLEINNV